MEVLPVLSLERRKALVVGGAGGGIGSAITHSLAQAGAHVSVITNDTSHAESIHSEAKERGHDIHCCLLYTSPSPRDGLLSRMPSSA